MSRAWNKEGGRRKQLSVELCQRRSSCKTGCPEASCPEMSSVDRQVTSMGSLGFLGQRSAC